MVAGVWIGVTSIAQAQPAPSPAPTPPPPPIVEQKPATPAPGDPFGEPITLTPQTIVYIKGDGTWDKAYDTLRDTYKSLYDYLAKAGIKPAGPAMTIYTAANDAGFSFQAAVPVADPPKEPPSGNIAVGKSPGGKSLHFVHRGAYDSMDNTYEAITNYLDEKQLEAQDLFVEQYQTDFVKTPEDRLVIDIYVPLK
jgi:effector-binding domain-containing protein